MRSISVAIMTITGLLTCSDGVLAQVAAKTPLQAPRDEQGTLDYRLGPGDLVSVRVSGVQEFDYSARVSNSARLRVPFVGVMIVAGMTTVEVEREIAKLITEHELVNEPSVRVQVTEHRARPTYVIGEVNAPGQFMITSEMYLLDLLSKAGDLLASADDKGYLYRRRWPRPIVDTRVLSAADIAAEAAAGGPVARPPAAPQADATNNETEEVIPIDFPELKKGTRPELNLRLQGGDTLYVPRRKPNNFYVIGNVKVPGAYTLPRRGTVSAAQAIVYAGGPLSTAKTSHGFLMRHDESGTRQAMPVDFAAILDGRQPDFQVRPNDIIFIPSSNVKTIGVGLLNLVPRLIQQFLIF